MLLISKRGISKIANDATTRFTFSPQGSVSSVLDNPERRHVALDPTVYDVEHEGTIDDNLSAESRALQEWCESTRYPDESCLYTEQLELQTKSMWPPMLGNYAYVYYGTLVPQYERSIRSNPLLVTEMQELFIGFKAAVVREGIDSFMKEIYEKKKVS